MHTALLVIGDTVVLDGSLSAALKACGFKVIQQNAEPKEGVNPPYSLLIQSAAQRGWRLESGKTPRTASAPTFILADPVQIAEMVPPLLALGICPVTDADLDALFATLYKLAGSDDAIVVELAESLLATNDEYLGELRASLEAGDCGQVASLAHRLKNSASMLSCQGLVEVCIALETWGKNSAADEPDNVQTAHALVAWLAIAVNVLDNRLRQDMARMGGK